MKNIFQYALSEQNIAVVYDQIERDSGYKIQDFCGGNSIVHYDNGLVAYEQFEFFNSMKDANERAKILPKISNRNYRNVKIITR